MDCGIPFCHAHGCPTKNRIPEWIDLYYRGRFREALELLQSTDNLPEITGRVCPAPCEAACTLAIDKAPVTIRQIELAIIERGFRENWVLPEPSQFRTGKRVAIVGSGPAGLACAQEVARTGHDVTVFERDDRPGGLLRYGIPDFKLEKWVIDRRVEQMRAEGVVFETGVDVGKDVSANYLLRGFDAIVLATGAMVPRPLNVPGDNLAGVHFAMEFLTQQNRRIAGDVLPEQFQLTAKDKHVVVIGGGDTGSDCVGTSSRQGAKSVTQIEILPMPPVDRAPDNPWPLWPHVLRTSSSHEEGCKRLWNVATKQCVGMDGRVQSLRCVKVAWTTPEGGGRPELRELAGSEFEIPADLVLLSMGFLHPRRGPLEVDLNLALDPRGNIRCGRDHETSAVGVFAAGDCVTGASLVVRAIHQGRETGRAVDAWLSSTLSQVATR